MDKKILIVEDERDIVLVLKSALENEGFSVNESYDGLDALEKIKQDKPDLILLDIGIPKLDGYSLNIRLKENPDTCNIPVIIITGKGQIKELMKLREDISIVDYIEKPFPIKLLIDKIKDIIKI